MMMKLIMFNTTEDLKKLTGLSRDELWDAGFDLDDWDVGFQTDEPMPNGYDTGGTGVSAWLTMKMDDCCCGYKETEYNGKYYYMVYHS